MKKIQKIIIIKIKINLIFKILFNNFNKLELTNYL